MSCTAIGRCCIYTLIICCCGVLLYAQPEYRPTQPTGQPHPGHSPAFMQHPQPVMEPNMQLMLIFEQYKQFILQSYPESASYDGDHRYDDRLTDISEEAIKQRSKRIHEFHEQVAAIADSGLKAENKVNKSLFLYQLEEDFKGERFNNWMMPLSQQGGIHLSLPQLPETQKLDNEDDFRRYQQRLKAFPKQVKDAIDNMRKGMKAQLVPPAVLMQCVIPQLEAIANAKTEDTPFLKLVKDKFNHMQQGSGGGKVIMQASSGLTDANWNDDLWRSLVKTVEESVLPSYRTLLDFVKKEYLPACRKDVGEWSLPDGLARYAYDVRVHTSVDISPDEIYNIGVKEVARIEKQMDEIRAKLKFKGSLAEFNEHLRTSPSFYYTKKEDLLNGFRSILQKSTAALPKLFTRLPEAPCEIKELEEYRAAAAPQAYYYPAPEDRSRPGYFYVNTFNLPARPKYTMTALTLHEAVPGHHLQIALAQEALTMPWFRRQMQVTSFVEGWALYAERLGFDMGLYNDDYQRYGAYAFEMWRACRLVVDAGIHARKWSREQAIDYLKKYTANSEADIISEVERYIANPGQATAYKIGQLKILELRAKAEKELGDFFNLQRFHDALLENGALPLPIWEKNMNEWLEKNKFSKQYR